MSINTTYSCDKSSWIEYTSCNEDYYRILIDNSQSSDEVFIDNVFVELKDGRFYGIDQFCVTNSNVTDLCYTEVLCIGNNETDCGPGRVMIDLDMNFPNQYIINGSSLFTDVTQIIDI